MTQTEKVEKEKAKKVAKRIEKILVEADMALYPFIYTNPYNGAQTPQVRLISTKKNNDEGSNNQEA